MIASPTPEDFLAAARTKDLKGITAADALFLCSQAFTNIDLAFRKGRPPRSAIRRLIADAAERKLEEPSPQPETKVPAEKPKMALHAIEGYGEVKDWGIQLAADMEDWRQGKIQWSDLDSGALISGPPGSGKTTFASALAESCGMYLVVASAARWQAKGHLGDYLKAMRAAFDLARKKAPCILFLDEFDSFGDRDTSGDDENRDYKTQAINGLLECLDGADGKEGVLVVGATNNPKAIDPALLRPGRLEVHLQIPLPDGPARIAILKQHLEASDIHGDLEFFTSVSRGWTGAMIQKVAKSARRLARRSAAPIDADMIAASLPRLREISGLELRSSAGHEAGHALIGVLLKPYFLEEVYVERHVTDMGTRQSLGQAVFTEIQGMVGTAKSHLDRITMLLGGIAAEHVLFGEYADGAGGEVNSDLALATDHATRLHRHMGLGETLSMDLGKGTRPFEELRKGDPLLREQVERTLRQQFDRAVELLRKHLGKLNRLTDLLIAQGHVDGDAVRAMVGENSND
jgi:cell division protease FtsH